MTAYFLVMFAAHPAAHLVSSHQAIPSGILDGLELYSTLFTTYDVELLPKVFHEKMSMSFLGNESDLSSFEVWDFEGSKKFMEPLFQVTSGKKPLSALPANMQPLVGLKLLNAIPPVKHYKLGPSTWVTQIHDMNKDPSGNVVAHYSTNLHWIKTPAGWRIKDKFFATFP